MKQLLSLLLIVLTVICLTSCGSDEIDKGKENNSMNSSETSSEVTSAPDLYENEPPAEIPKTNFAPQAPVNENDRNIPKSKNDEPWKGDPDDGRIAREGQDENDHYPDPNAPEPDIYGGEAIELQG